jgi:hypothetical protein
MSTPENIKLSYDIEETPLSVEEASEGCEIKAERRPALPAPENIKDVDLDQLEVPAPIIEGILRRGEKAVLGGASKSHKSWGALALAICVAYGKPWMGHRTQKGRVLFINLELAAWCAKKRIGDICRALDVSMPDLDLWTLRGYVVSAQDLRREMDGRFTAEYDLIVIDPIYKLLGDADENSARDIAKVLGEIERIAEKSRAAVLLPAHFAKGNAAAKESMDRMSGSGVLARDPDTIMTLTRHQEEGAYTFDITLRTFPPIASNVVRWKFPLFEPDPGLDPAQLKTAKNPLKYTDEAILSAIGFERKTFDQWFDAAQNLTGISRSTFATRVRGLVKSKKVIKSSSPEGYYRPKPIAVPVQPPPPPPMEIEGPAGDVAELSGMPPAHSEAPHSMSPGPQYRTGMGPV